MGLLEDKVAVIAGAGRGVGRAVAEGYAAEGAAVALAARSADEIQELAVQITARGGKALAVRTDITRKQEVEQLFARVRDELGAVDILVNNAAANGPIGMLWETDPEEWLSLYDVNVVGMVRCAHAALPDMIARRRGKIIIVGSVAGYSDRWAALRPELAAYGLTKAATNRFARCLSEQVKPYGINVNCVGVSARTRLDYDARRQLARIHGESPALTPEMLPAQDRTLPEENVAPFVFLASTLSDHITGQYLEANTLPDGLRESHRA